MVTAMNTDPQSAIDRLAIAAWSLERAQIELREAVIDARQAGVSKMEIHAATGLSRVTINKWLNDALTPA